MNIQIDRKGLSGFRRRAWARFPHKEYVEALFGIVQAGIPIVSLFYPMEHTADKWACDYAPLEIKELSQIAAEHGLQFLGTIHTHMGSNTCAHPSKNDVKSSQELGERLFGIVHLYKTDSGRRRSTTEFFPSKDAVKVTLI